MRGFIVASSSAGGGGDEVGASISSSKALYNMAVHGELRGLDREQRLVSHQRVVCLFLTDTQLVVASVRGSFKVKPNEVLHTIERSGLRCEWFDYDSSGTNFRNLSSASRMAPGWHLDGCSPCCATHRPQHRVARARGRSGDHRTGHERSRRGREDASRRDRRRTPGLGQLNRGATLGSTRFAVLRHGAP